MNLFILYNHVALFVNIIKEDNTLDNTWKYGKIFEALSSG